MKIYSEKEVKTMLMMAMTEVSVDPNHSQKDGLVSTEELEKISDIVMDVYGKVLNGLSYEKIKSMSDLAIYRLSIRK